MGYRVSDQNIETFIKFIAYIDRYVNVGESFTRKDIFKELGIIRPKKIESVDTLRKKLAQLGYFKKDKFKIILLKEFPENYTHKQFCNDYNKLKQTI